MSKTGAGDPGEIREKSQTFEISRDGSEPMVLSIVTAVSAVVGKDPAELQPLSDHVDPEALEKLVAGTADRPAVEGPVVEFAYEGCRIRVGPDDRLEITLPADRH